MAIEKPIIKPEEKVVTNDKPTRTAMYDTAGNLSGYKDQNGVVTPNDQGTPVLDPQAGKGGDLGGQPLPRVAPKAPITPTDFGSAGKPFKEVQKATYEDLLKESKGSLDAINKTAEETLAKKRAATAGVLAGAGLGGSTAGESAELAQEQPILDKRQSDTNDLLQTIRENATTLSEKELQYDTQLREGAKADATDFIKQLATSHTDLSKFKSENPQDYQHLVDMLGSSNYVDAIFANNIPKEAVLSNTINGNSATVISQDPITNKVSAHTYDLGITIPKSWTMEKIGTNAVIYHDATWSPTDPKTFQIFAIDPLTGLPTTQTGGNENPTVTQEKSTIKDLSDAISKVESGSGNNYNTIGTTITVGQYKGEQALGKYQIVPGAWFDVLGLDPKSEEDKQAFLNDPSKQEEAFTIVMGSLLKKYNKNTKKAIAAYFGGDPAAKAHGTAVGDKMSDGNMSVNDYVSKVENNMQPARADSQSLTAQAGISLQVFNYLTQGTTSMSRLSAAQRNAITAEANKFLNSKGIDISTFQTQYRTYNDVLSSNITRQNKTQIMEQELLGTVDNLKTVVSDKDLGDLNLDNVTKVWAGQQVNDELATQYAFHFQQLKNELAGYFAASQGKASPDVIDNQDAAAAVVNGMATGSLNGFKTSIENSTRKMKRVLDSTVDETRKQIWGLFGVQDKYKSALPQNVADAQSGATGTLDDGTAVTKADNGKWYDKSGKSYDDDGKPI